MDRITDRTDMTSAVDLGRKASTQIIIIIIMYQIEKHIRPYCTKESRISK